MSHISIAIDGPAGAGKSTVAKVVARRLKFLYVDTGAMYRAISWIAVQFRINPEDESLLVKEIACHHIRFDKNMDGLLDIYVDNKNITLELRNPEISQVVSLIAVHPRIRSMLTQWQRDFATRYSVVMDGRDIGTVVLPNANVKVFLTADLRERARRRSNEFVNKGYNLSLDEIMQSLAVRDERDASRNFAPLKQAEDAVCIDSTGISIEEIVNRILELVERLANE